MRCMVVNDREVEERRLIILNGVSLVASVLSYLFIYHSLQLDDYHLRK